MAGDGGDSAGWTPGDDVAPFLQATPPGANRLTEGFAAIEAEIGKIGSPNNLEVDWSVVARESEPYLQKVAKDLRVATYLALAWGETKGGTGLRRGFDLLVGLLGEPWEGLKRRCQK